jgi:hypothetical protein
MYNINRDYLIVLNPKTSKVTVPELNYYIYDKYTANLFVNLVTVENGKAVNIPDADQYKLVLHVLKPTNEIQDVENIELISKEKALFQIELNQELTKNIGRYKCELLTIDKNDHVVQSAKFSYRVKKSIYNDLDVVTETPQYPIIITLLNKLQDIDKYEEERRANEVARVAAEKARVKDYTDLRQTVTTDINTMQEKIDSFDGKVQEVDSAVQQMRTNITNYQTEKNKELDNYKTQKDTQINTAIKGMETTIDTYKTEKDKQINNKITQQDTKIDKAIDLQNKNIQASTKALNDKLDAAVQDQNDTIAANNQAQNKVISDAIAEQNKTINTVVENDKIQDERLEALDYNSQSFITAILELNDKDEEHENRMTAIEAVNVEQNNRLDAIEIKNDQQDSRLNDVEAKNKKQDMDLKCLFAESHSERITLDDEVGNSVFLQNSKQGFATVDELKGNTLVNCNKDTDKELILNGNIDTSGYGTVTTTEGVDGGKVDVALEGNTMVNVCDQEDPVAITKSYEVTTGNHVALQGEYDGKCRPVLNGNTLVSYQKSSINKGKQFTVNGQYQYKSISTLNTTVKDKLYFRIKFTVDELNTTSQEVNIFTHYPGGYRTPVKLFMDCTVGKIEEASTIREHEQARADQKYMMLSIGMYAPIPEDVPEGSPVCKYTIHDYVIYNLTQLFGAGKEPEQKWCDNNLPYLEGMQSSFEDKLITDEKDANNGKYKVDYKVTGKNKFDKSKPINSGNMSNDGNVITSDAWVISDYNSILPNTNYTLSYVSDDTSYYQFKIAWYDDNLKFINMDYYQTNGEYNHTYLSPNNAKYYRISYSTTVSNKPVTRKNIQIEEGTTATTYEPYKEYTKTFYLNSPLLEGDTIEDVNGKATHVHRYKSVVLDGSDDENYTIQSINANGIVNFLFHLVNNKLPLAIGDDFGTNSEAWLVSNYVIDNNNISNAKTTGCLPATNKAIYIRELASNYDTIEKFKNKLKNTPTTIVYPLAKPTYETISNDSILCDSYVNGHLDVDSIVPIEKVDFRSWGTGLKYLYPSTEYTIQFESDNNGILNALAMNDYDTLWKLNIVKGVNKFTITTSDKINTNYLWTNGIGFNMSNIVVTPKVEQTFGYFKGMKSVGECEDLEVVSSNNDNTLSNKQTMTHEPLRGLPNGVKDKYVIIDGKWYIERNCMAVQFKDLKYSRTDVYQKAEFPDVIGFRLSNTGIQPPIMCDRFAYTNDRIINFEELLTNKEAINITSSNTMDEFFITIQKTKLQTLDFKGLIKYFTDNPMEIITKATTPTYEPIEYNSFEVYSGTTHISNNSIIPCNMVIRNSGFNCILKPNTTYTVSSNNGLSSVVTKASIGDSVLRFYDKDTTSITKMNKVLVLEGDYITGNPPIPAFFKGMESTFEQELVTDEQDKNYGKYKVTVKAVGKNLFNKDTVIKGKYQNCDTNTNNFNITNHPNYNISDFVPVKPNTQYTISGTDIKYHAYYDINKEPIRSTGTVNTIFTTPSNAYYMIFNLNSTDDLNKIQIERGAKATEYEPYKENNITFYIKEPLRGVGNVKDKVYVKEDKVVAERNIRQKLLTGADNEHWLIHNDKDKNVIEFRCNVGKPFVTNEANLIICDKFIGKSAGNIDRIAWATDTVYITISRNRLTTVDVVGLRQWLNDNNVFVQNQLAEPTYEEVEYFDLKLFVEIFKDTTIIYNSNIPVTSTINYTYATPLTDAVNTVSDISDQQDSMIIDMATQVATMEMMLM